LQRREAAGGQLNSEGSGAWQAVVLPVGRRSLQPVVVVEAHAGRTCVDAPGITARPPGPDEVQVLVEPDRQPRPEAQDQVAADPRLTLGERIGAFRSTPRPFWRLPRAYPSGFRSGTIQ